MIRKITSGILLLCILSLWSCKNNDKQTATTANDTTESIEGENVTETIVAEPEKPALPAGVRALLESYPDQIKDFKDGNLIFADGTTLLYDDGKEKDFEYMLDNSSPKDMFYVAYTVPETSPEYLADAGRSRSEDLFKKMYGSSSSEVNKRMEKVNWFGQSLPFTSINGGAEQLRKVAEELAQHPEYKKYMKSAGTFYWRPVRGAKRLSAHSYGIAIDIGVDYSDYWLWKNPNAGETGKFGYTNRMPKGIVDIFQKYGFIWGGAWYHFDTMHFEYRPEILKYAEIMKNESKE